MARAEIRFGFDPEDRELIARMLDAQDREAEEGAQEVAAQRGRADAWRSRALQAESRIGQDSTRLRQATNMLESARKLAREALDAENAKVSDYREALSQITQL